MKKILIVDDEKLLGKDIEGYNAVYTLFDTNITEVNGIPVINLTEITTSLYPLSSKFNALISEIIREHSFEYEVMTNDPEAYAVKSYVCKFKKENNNDKE